MTHPLLLSLFDETERRPLTVSELTAQVRSAVETRFRSVWVEGEVSNFRAHTSGHWYFTIKDETAQLRATCFRNTNRAIRFRPTDGLQVRARGRLTVYEPRGEYELEVEGLDPVGAGALRVAFEQMRERLSSEGLFDEERKRPLPLFPRRIGIVTSASGAALRDILTVISRRTRTVDVLIAPARVQGEGAALEIVRAIELLNRYHLEATARGSAEEEGVDAIIVGRGGGSIEDLWAFNEEAVVRAIASSAIPVISAVGHETDTTIADFAADVRAATPSAAAELVAAREDELEALVFNHTRDLVRAIRFRLINERSRVAEAAMSQGFDEVRARLHSTGASLAEARHRLETLINRATARAARRTDAISCRLSPARLATRVAESRVRFAVVRGALDAATRARLDDERARLAVMVASLDALSPLAVLKRGYALARDAEGRLVRDARELQVGDTLNLRLAVGSLLARVEKQENN
jgi:exodeoxyribonuclease VII large subunit